MTDKTDKEESVLSPEIKYQLVRKLERHKVIGLDGAELRSHESKYLEFHQLSGVILFERNIESLPQITDLIGNVEAKLAGDGLAPLIMADHEGDFVSELRKLIGVPPSAMAIAASRDVGLSHDVAYETGVAMMKLGVNTVLAPVADCFLEAASPITGLRSFGCDPAKVAEYVAESIRGFRDAGVITCVKHFPGHGSTPYDSHETLPEIGTSMEDLRAGEIVPFGAAVRAGVDMVMMAHVIVGAIGNRDEGVPASFDARLMRGLLRDELGFRGVVITDALEMAGARAYARTRFGGLAGGFERTVLAGADLMLYSAPVPETIGAGGDPQAAIAIEVMQAIIETLSKVVDRSRADAKLERAAASHEGLRGLLGILEESGERIARLRRLAAGRRSPPSVPDGNVIRFEDYPSVPAIYKTVAEKSVVLVRDPNGFVPVAESSEAVLLPVQYAHGESLKRQDLATFVESLRRRFPSWKVAATLSGFNGDDLVRLDAVTAAVGPDKAKRGSSPSTVPAIVVPVFSARGIPPRSFLEGLVALIERQRSPLVIVTGWPLVDWVPETVGCLVTLGASAPVAAAVAGVLSGDAEATASLEGLVPDLPRGI
jgi:beta-glucosidase-like glycosyl hydrolase